MNYRLRRYKNKYRDIRIMTIKLYFLKPIGLKINNKFSDYVYKIVHKQNIINHKYLLRLRNIGKYQ